MNGDPLACCELARMYESGKGAAINPGRARKWYEKAASPGNEEAKKQLAQINKPVK